MRRHEELAKLPGELLCNPLTRFLGRHARPLFERENDQEPVFRIVRPRQALEAFAHDLVRLVVHRQDDDMIDIPPGITRRQFSDLLQPVDLDILAHRAERRPQVERKVDRFKEPIGVE